MYIVELRNGGIKNMTVDSDYKSGCETCGYEAERFNKIVIDFSDYSVTISAVDRYAYPLSMLSQNFNGTYSTADKHELTNKDIIDLFKLDSEILNKFTEEQLISYITTKLCSRCKNVDIRIKTKTIGEMYFGHREEEETPKDIYLED